MPAHFKICTCLLDSGQLQFAPVLIGESIESAQTCSCEHVKWLVSCTNLLFSALCRSNYSTAMNLVTESLKYLEVQLNNIIMIHYDSSTLHCRKWKLKVELCSLQSIILSGIIIWDCHTKPGSHINDPVTKKKKNKERRSDGTLHYFLPDMIIWNCFTSPFFYIKDPEAGNIRP